MASTITRLKYNRKYLALHEDERELQKSMLDITTKNDILREIQSVSRNIDAILKVTNTYVPRL